ALVLNMASGSIVSFASELQNKKVVTGEAELTNEGTIKKFDLLNNEKLSSYNEKFKVDNSKIKSITNNGGKYASSTIDKAIDNNLSTHWETGKANSGSFTNEVVIELTENTILNRLVYGARQESAKGKGFAKKLEIYASTSEAGDDFNLVFSGEYLGSTGDIVEVKFKPTEFRRVKFKFIEANQNWASASEFMLYKEDKASDELKNIFTNGLQMELKAGYDINKLNELETEVATHPFKEELKTTLDAAKKIVNNEVDFKGTYWNLESRGNSVKESQKRKIWNFQDWQATGYRVKPGDVINVYVEVEKDEPLPYLIFKQMDTAHNGTRSITLQQGKNTITIPEVEVDSIRPGTALGGVLYTVNPYTKEEQSREPQIRFENLNNYPNFVKGVDNDEEVLKELEDYVKALENDKTLPNVFEVFGDKSLINVTATEALKFYKSSGKTPSYSAQVQDDIIKETMKFWGFDNSSEIHSDFNFRYVTMVKNLSGGVAMNAANGITGMRPGSQSGALGGDTSWGFMHELGHNFDTRNRLIVEVTNNILPLQFQRLASIPTRLSAANIYEDRVYPKVVKEDYENNTMFPGTDTMNFQHIAALWQIAVYDEDFYPEFEKRFRETSERFGSVNAVHNGWVKIASDVLKMDVSEHFERHGAKLTDETKEYVSKYPKLNKNTWYINDSLYLGGGAFTDTLDYSITTIETKAEGNVINFTIDEKNKENTLGYEIYRDGELIGFTERNTFVDKTRAEDTNHEYKIVAFDKTITGKGEATLKTFTPKLSGQEKIVIALGEEYNHLNYIKATNYKGEDIS
ncbi:MAG: M60 family metallopeptidase, partial [Clostridium sp.]